MGVGHLLDHQQDAHFLADSLHVVRPDSMAHLNALIRLILKACLRVTIFFDHLLLHLGLFCLDKLNNNRLLAASCFKFSQSVDRLVQFVPQKNIEALVHLQL